MFYRPKQNREITQENPILYVVPKTTVESKQLGAVVIDQSNLTSLPASKVIEDDVIWKVAMWGTPRDAALISESCQKGTLKDIITKFHWEIGDGFQASGSDRNPAPWMRNYPFLPSKSLKRFHIPSNALQLQNRTVFHRPRDKRRYTAPLCLVKVTLSNGQIAAAYSDSNVCYTDGIIGISGLEKHDEMLKIVACYLNSNLARYFLFLTASVWGVERDDILKDDYLNLPFIMPEVNSTAFRRLVEIYDKLNSLGGFHSEQKSMLLEEIDTIFFDLFSFNDSEIVLIQDTLKYTIDQFQKKEQSIAYAPVNKSILLDYANAYCDVQNTFLAHQKKSIEATVYAGAMPLQVVSFILNKIPGRPKRVINASNELKKILDRLDRLLLGQHSQGIYVRRNVRIYDGDTIYIIKPNEARHWTRTVAFNDADETLAEIFEIWKEMR